MAVAAIYSFPYARQTGMGLAFKQGARWYTLAAATIVSLVISILLLYWWGPVLMVLLLLFVSGIAVFFNKRLGGLTGDCYGAIVELSEVITLILLVIFSRWL